MNWPGFYMLGGAWLFLLIGPLVVLYFLKLRRPRQEVPSLVLWRQVLNDNRVNSPFQRFKRNILLLLQLLLLAAIVLAAMQPYMRGNVADGDRLPILIDNSASMAALDQPGGRSRLDVARQQVHQMIDGLSANQELAIISFSRNARRLTDFTSNKRLLREAVDSIVVEDVASDIEDVLRMTAALGQTQPFERVLMLSDGNFPARTNFPLPFQLEYQQLGSAGANFGITAFNARRVGDAGWDVFAVIEGSHNITGSPATVNATVQLLQDGEPIALEETIISQGQTQRLVFPIDATEATSLELRLTVDGFDALASDNVAFLELEPARRVWVHVPRSLYWHRLAAGSVDNVRLIPGAEGESRESAFDLVISDRAADADLASPVRLFIDVLPDELSSILALRDEPGTIIDWHRNEPLLRYVELTNVYTLSHAVWQPGAGEADLERLGYEVIVYGADGPMLLRHRAADELSYYVLFNSEHSSLHVSPYFVIMVQNMVEIAMHRAGLSETHGQPTGVLAPLTVGQRRSYRVRGPRGPVQQLQSDERSRLAGVAARHVGRYIIEEAGLTGGTVAQVGASLLNSRESSLIAEREVRFREQAVQATDDLARTDYSHWRTLLFIAVGLMAVEWWYFQRKPGGY